MNLNQNQIIKLSIFLSLFTVNNVCSTSLQSQPNETHTASITSNLLNRDNHNSVPVKTKQETTETKLEQVIATTHVNLIEAEVTTNKKLSRLIGIAGGIVITDAQVEEAAAIINANSEEKAAIIIAGTEKMMAIINAEPEQITINGVVTTNKEQVAEIINAVNKEAITLFKKKAKEKIEIIKAQQTRIIRQLEQLINKAQQVETSTEVEEVITKTEPKQATTITQPAVAEATV